MPSHWGRRPAQRDWLKQFCVGRGLDIGCGHQKIHPDAIGIDVLKGPKCVAEIHASGDELDFLTTGQWDYIVSCQALEHIADTKKSLRGWLRILKPGGIVAVTVPDGSREPRAVLDARHLSAFTPDLLALFFEDCGFKVEEVLSVEEAGWPTIMLRARKPD